MSHEKNFLQMWDLCRNTENNIHFHYRTNSEKISSQTFQSIQKNPIFGPFLVHFPNFWHTMFHAQLHAPHNDKTYDKAPRKQPGGWKNGQNYHSS